MGRSIDSADMYLQSVRQSDCCPRLLGGHEQPVLLGSCLVRAATRSHGEIAMHNFAHARQLLLELPYSTPCPWHLRGQHLFGASEPKQTVMVMRQLITNGCLVTLVPAQTPAEAVFELNPQGVVLSNGPGEPAACENVIRTIQRILEEVDEFGCSGNCSGVVTHKGFLRGAD